MQEQQTQHINWGQQQASPHTLHPYRQPPYEQPPFPQPQKPEKNWAAFWFGILYMLIFILSQLFFGVVIALGYVVFLAVTGGDTAAFLSEIDLLASGGAFQNIMAATLIVSSFATIGILWFIAKLRGFNPKEAAFMNPTTPLILFVSLIFGIAYSVSFNSFVNLPVFGDMPTIESQQILYGSLIMALTGSILVPVVEEIVFRGFVLNELRRGVGIVSAFLISSFVFGLIHGHPLWALMAGIIGMIFALFALRTRSVYPAIMAHIGVNAASFVFIEISKGVDSFSPIYIDFLNMPTLLTLMTIAGVLLVVSFIVIIVKSEPASTIGPAPEPAKKPAPPTYPYATPYAAPVGGYPSGYYYPSAPTAAPEVFPQAGAFPQQGQPYPSQGAICPPCPQDCPHLAHCMQYGYPQQQYPQQQTYPNPQVQEFPVPQTQQDINYPQNNQEDLR